MTRLLVLLSLLGLVGLAEAKTKDPYEIVFSTVPSEFNMQGTFTEKNPDVLDITISKKASKKKQCFDNLDTFYVLNYEATPNISGNYQHKMQSIHKICVEVVK